MLQIVAQRDCKATRAVVIVSQQTAHHNWPGEDTFGKQLKRGLPVSESPWAIVVGVVGDIRQSGLDEEPTPTLYWRRTEVGSGIGMTVRTSGDPMALVPASMYPVRTPNRTIPRWQDPTNPSSVRSRSRGGTAKCVRKSPHEHRLIGRLQNGRSHVRETT